MDEPAGRIIGLYQRNAAVFDRDRSRALFERGWLNRFLALLPPGGAVLDLGCGMGEPVAQHLIAAGHPVTGVDSAPALVGLCRQRFPGQTWVVGDMRTVAAGRHAGILAWDSFFHLPRDDQRAMVAQFRRHALPGAALMFTSGPADGVAIGAWCGEPLYHASLDPDEYRALLAAHGFAVVAHRAEDPDCGGHTVWLAQAAG